MSHNCLTYEIAILSAQNYPSLSLYQTNLIELSKLTPPPKKIGSHHYHQICYASYFIQNVVVSKN
jgi:hypothetical protein